MTNKLVVIISSLKVPKIKKILLYEMKFLVRNYNCLQNPWLGGCRPQIPVLCPQLNLLTPPPQQNSWVCYWFWECCLGPHWNPAPLEHKPVLFQLEPPSLCYIDHTCIIMRLEGRSCFNVPSHQEGKGNGLTLPQLSFITTPRRLIEKWGYSCVHR